MSDYMTTYNETWKDIVENPDGTLDKDKVARELADYSMIMGHCTEIYLWASNEAVGKPATLPSVVIGMAEERLGRFENAIDEALEVAPNILYDGDHHKQWVVDQMVRAMTLCPMVTKTSPRPNAQGQIYQYEGYGESEAYKRFVTAHEGWDEGIAP